MRKRRKTIEKNGSEEKKKKIRKMIERNRNKEERKKDDIKKSQRRGEERHKGLEYLNKWIILWDLLHIP